MKYHDMPIGQRISAILRSTRAVRCSLFLVDKLASKNLRLHIQPEVFRGTGYQPVPLAGMRSVARVLRVLRTCDHSVDL